MRRQAARASRLGLLALFLFIAGRATAAGDEEPAPLLMLLASADDELSPRVCERFAVQAPAAGAPLELIIYDGAEHNFDDPSPTRQSRSANRRATEDAGARAERFFRVHLGS
jgi:dienelactone hydrolase